MRQQVASFLPKTALGRLGGGGGGSLGYLSRHKEAKMISHLAPERLLPQVTLRAATMGY